MRQNIERLEGDYGNNMTIVIYKYSNNSSMKKDYRLCFLLN